MYVLRACFYWQLPLVLFFHKKKGEIGAKWLHTNIIWVFENGGLFRVEKNSKLNCTKRTMAYSLQLLGLVSSCIHLTAKCIQITLLPSSFFGRAIFTPFLLHVHDEWCLSLVLVFFQVSDFSSYSDQRKLLLHLHFRLGVLRQTVCDEPQIFLCGKNDLSLRLTYREGNFDISACSTINWNNMPFSTWLSIS